MIRGDRIMTSETSLKPADALSLRNIKFPELPLYIISSLIFLNLGILLGSLNSLFWGNETTGISWIDDLVTAKIHQTHWTSTLLGGVSILMLGQIYFFFSQISEKKNPLHLFTIVVLVSWIIGVLSSYGVAWDKSINFWPLGDLLDKLDIDRSINKDFVIYPIQFAIALFLIIILVFFLDSDFRKNARNHPALLYFVSACIWLSLAVFWRLDLELGALDRVFLTTYIYGFFSLTLFGSLTFVLPIMTKQKPKSNFSVYFNLILLNLAAAIIVYYDYQIEEFDNNYFSLGLIGPLVWAMAGFLFIMYVFDLIYKDGIAPYLVALLVALSMFGFFVVDTVMKNMFEQWVEKRHFHFMFVGTLIMTIVAIGSRLIVMQYNEDESNDEKVKSVDNSDSNRGRTNLISIIGIGLTILGVLGVLTGFTIENYMMAAISGVILFFGLLITEIIMISKMLKR